MENALGMTVEGAILDTVSLHHVNLLTICILYLSAVLISNICSILNSNSVYSKILNTFETHINTRIGIKR